MKTIKFEDVLKQFEVEARQSENFAEGRKHMVDANICKLLMERYPDADPDKTVEEIVDPAEMVEIVREAEAMAEASMKSVIEQGSREVYRRLVSASEPPRGSNDSHRIAL